MCVLSLSTRVRDHLASLRAPVCTYTLSRSKSEALQIANPPSRPSCRLWSSAIYVELRTPTCVAPCACRLLLCCKSVRAHRHTPRAAPARASRTCELPHHTRALVYDSASRFQKPRPRAPRVPSLASAPQGKATQKKAVARRARARIERARKAQKSTPSMTT